MPGLLSSSRFPECQTLGIGEAPRPSTPGHTTRPRGVEPFEYARGLLALGRAERRAKQRRAARESLVRAKEWFERLGMPLWQERVAQELSRIGGRGPRGEGLTEMEANVAKLAAEGLTNRESDRPEGRSRLQFAAAAAFRRLSAFTLTFSSRRNVSRSPLVIGSSPRSARAAFSVSSAAFCSEWP
jgi:hypothetical protein